MRPSPGRARVDVERGRGRRPAARPEAAAPLPTSLRRHDALAVPAQPSRACRRARGTRRGVADEFADSEIERGGDVLASFTSILWSRPICSSAVATRPLLVPNLEAPPSGGSRAGAASTAPRGHQRRAAAPSSRAQTMAGAPRRASDSLTPSQLGGPRRPPGASAPELEHALLGSAISYDVSTTSALQQLLRAAPPAAADAAAVVGRRRTRSAGT